MEEGVEFGFGEALKLLNRGESVRRKGWNGGGKSLFVQRPGTHSKMTHPYLFMTVPNCEEGTRLLPWQPAQVDIFANDWEIT